MLITPADGFGAVRHPTVSRMTLRACFVALADGLKDDLADPDGEFRMLYGYHAVRIRSAFDGYPDLPLHQDSVAGFLHGFLLTVGHCASGDTLQAAFPVLGGALLLGRAL